MKRITILLSFISTAFALNAQSVDEGVQQMYYERYQSADNTFHKILQQDPNNATAWYYLEKDYLLENKPDKASDSIQRVPASVKNDPWYKVAYGTVLMQQGKKDEAGNYFNDAIKDTREKNAGILSSVADAQIHSKSGDINYAIDLLNKAIKRNKKNSINTIEVSPFFPSI